MCYFKQALRQKEFGQLLQEDRQIKNEDDIRLMLDELLSVVSKVNYWDKCSPMMKSVKTEILIWEIGV